MRRRFRAGAAALGAAAALMLAPAQAHAVGLLGLSFISNGGSVSVRYLGSSAAYFNTLQWFTGGYGAVNYRPSPNDNTVDYNNSGYVINLFYNQNGYILGSGTPVTASNVGDVVELGAIPMGQEILLGLFVHNEYFNGSSPNPDWLTQDADDYTYFSGPDIRNRDNRFHLAITDLGGGTFQFEGGWEDIFGGGDEDYNDVIFQISGVSVTPEPMSMALVGTGLAGLAGFARRRRKQEQDSQAS